MPRGEGTFQGRQHDGGGGSCRPLWLRGQLAYMSVPRSDCLEDIVGRLLTNYEETTETRRRRVRLVFGSPGPLPEPFDVAASAFLVLSCHYSVTQASCPTLRNMDPAGFFVAERVRFGTNEAQATSFPEAECGWQGRCWRESTGVGT